MPFRGPDLPAILRCATRGDYLPLPLGVGAEARDLVSRLLQPVASNRISMEELVALPWLAGQLGGLEHLGLGLPVLASSDASRDTSAADEGSGEPSSQAEAAEPARAGDASASDGDYEDGGSAGANTSRQQWGGTAAAGGLSRNGSGLAAARHGSLKLVLPGLEGLALEEGEEEEPGGCTGAPQDGGTGCAPSSGSPRRSSASAAASRTASGTVSFMQQQLTPRRGSFAAGVQRSSGSSTAGSLFK